MGSRSLRDQLQRDGHPVGRDRVRRLMRCMGLHAVYRRPRTTIPDQSHRIYPYRLRGLSIDRPNQVWAADVTYLPMARGFLYLVAIMDWHSRKVLAWRLSNTLNADFCVEALERPCGGMGPPRSSTPIRAVTSDAFTHVLRDAGVTISMDGKGRWMDNVFIERLWRSVKYEEVYLHAYANPAKARQGLDWYFRFSNRRRTHQALDRRTPNEVYFQTGGLRKAARHPTTDGPHLSFPIGCRVNPDHLSESRQAETKEPMIETNVDASARLKVFPFTGMPPFRFAYWQAWSIWVAIVLLPFVAVGVESGASYVFAWLVFVGLFFGRTASPALTAHERLLFLGLALFFGTVIIATFFGSDLSGDLSQVGRYVVVLLAFPAYLAVRHYISEPGPPLVVGLFLSPIGALFFSIDWDLDRLVSALTFNERLIGAYHPIVFSNLSALFLCLFLAYVLIFLKSPTQLIISATLLSLGIVVLLGSASRMGILFFPFGVLLVLWLLKGHIVRNHLIGFLSGMGLVTAIVVLNPPQLALSRLEQAVAALAGERNADGGSTVSRFEMWRDSLAMWSENPVTGVGPGSFQTVVEAMRAQGATDFTYTLFGHAHSIYFHSLATLGSLGFVVMLGTLFLVPVLYGIRAWKSALTPWGSFYAAGLIFTVFAFLAFGLTEFWIGRNVFFRTYLILIIIFVSGIATNQLPLKVVEREGKSG